MKEWIKKILPRTIVRRVRYLNRFRWIAKWRLLGFWGFDIRANPWRAARYVLLDPEVESYSYEIENEEELQRFVADLLDVESSAVRKWISEAQSDPILMRDRGWSWTRKRKLPIGYRLAWYVVVRALKPGLIVEAGIHEGLGSEVLLCALRRNREEGHEGNLLSFDHFPDTGGLVLPELKTHWKRVFDSTRTALEPGLDGKKVGLFIHDIPHSEEPSDFEFEIIRRHADDRLVIVDSVGRHPALRRFCERYGGRCSHFCEKPKGHIFQGSGSLFAVFSDAARSISADPDQTFSQSVVSSQLEVVEAES